MPTQQYETHGYSRADIRAKVVSAILKMAKGRNHIQTAIYLLHDAAWMLQVNAGTPEAVINAAFSPPRTSEFSDSYGVLTPITERLAAAIGVMENGKWAEAMGLIEDALGLIKKHASGKGIAVKMERTPQGVGSEIMRRRQ